MRKIRFYFIGLIPGLLIMLFILNKKGASCSGYLPNSRVIAETLSKEITYSEDVKIEMQKMKIDEQFLRDSLISKGTINFEKSKAQQEPCPFYVLTFRSLKNEYEMSFEKCNKEVKILGLKKYHK